jgi:hypothetical protein
MAVADCQAGASAALDAVSRNPTAVRVDLDRGVYCPTPGLLFAVTGCPAGALPPPGGGEWIGHALVTFFGSTNQTYLNIAKNGQVVSAVQITSATPPPP